MLLLDLRREPMQKNLRLRYRVTMAVRKAFIASREDRATADNADIAAL